jgi:hypothetical protein
LSERGSESERLIDRECAPHARLTERVRLKERESVSHSEGPSLGARKALGGMVTRARSRPGPGPARRARYPARAEICRGRHAARRYASGVATAGYTIVDVWSCMRVARFTYAWLIANKTCDPPPTPPLYPVGSISPSISRLPPPPCAFALLQVRLS